MKGTVRPLASLVVGCAGGVACAAVGFTILRALWPAYAAAEPEKAYTLAMLVSRLILGALSIAGAAGITTIIAGDNGRAAYWLGGVALLISLPIHLYYEWSSYPIWYHIVYLSYLVPIAGLSARVAEECRTIR
jgi:hypothetical protein